jgi:ABC-type multidrug transport system permease subunit
VLQFEQRAGPLPDPQTELFTDGGMRFVAALGQVLDQSPSVLWSTLGLGVVGYAMAFVVASWLCVANARAEEAQRLRPLAAGPNPARSTRATLHALSQRVQSTAHRVIGALPGFALLLVPTGLFLGLFLFVAFVGVVVCESVLLTPTDERAADLVTWGVAAVLLLPALLLQPISDLARLEVLRSRRSPFAALQTALHLALHERRAVLGTWALYMLAAWIVVLGTTYTSQQLDPGALQTRTLLLEQFGLLWLSGTRSRWLAHAAQAIYEKPRHAA